MCLLNHLEVDCRGQKAAVEVVGEGRPIVYVGTAAPMAWTRPSAVALAELGFLVVNFDYGSVGADPEPRTALDQSLDVVAVMDEVGVGEGVLVGLSRGAITSYGVAARHPARVIALVQAFPVAGWADTLHEVHSERETESTEHTGDMIDEMLATIFTPGFLADHYDEARAMVTTAPGSVVRVDRSEEDVFVDDDVADCPILVVEGGSDQVVTAAHPARYLKTHPDAAHKVVPEAEHGWLMERPEEFARIVAKFASGL